MAAPVIVELTSELRTFIATSVPPNVADNPLIDPASTDLAAPMTLHAPPFTDPAANVPTEPTDIESAKTPRTETAPTEEAVSNPPEIDPAVTWRSAPFTLMSPVILDVFAM